METSHPAGWLPDPIGRYHYRYWTGSEWTAQVSTNGSNETDPQGLAPNAAVTTPGRPPVPVPRPSWSMDVRLLVLGGAAALILGAFLPWVKAEAGVFSATKNGIDGDGVITLVLAGALALAFLIARSEKTGAWLVITFAALATAVAAYDTIDVARKADELTSQASFLHADASVGIGLWLSLAGAIAALVGGVLAIRRAGAQTSR